MQDSHFEQSLDLARRGDQRALERVLVRSRQDLRRYAEYHCAVNDVEDAVQESLLLVSRKLSSLREPAAFTSWLFRELLTYMMEDPRVITPCTHLLFMAKNLERVGDHATNIAENLWFQEHGETAMPPRDKRDDSSTTV